VSKRVGGAAFIDGGGGAFPAAAVQRTVQRVKGTAGEPVLDGHVPLSARSPCLTLTTIAPVRCARAAHVIADRRAGTSRPAPDTGSPSSRATSS
jgi:hypothetical protein